MNTAGKIAAVLVLIAAVGITVALRQSRFSGLQEQTQDSGPSSTTLPRLVDLGAGKCIPCKMMAPILEELKTEYAGRFKVDFIDVWENPDVGAEYNIRMIPTQIFYDASGKELVRHEGFFSKADILAKWKELGLDIEPKQE
jgi:thioredoxin 1